MAAINKLINMSFKGEISASLQVSKKPSPILYTKICLDKYWVSVSQVPAINLMLTISLFTSMEQKKKAWTIWTVLFQYHFTDFVYQYFKHRPTKEN